MITFFVRPEYTYLSIKNILAASRSFARVVIMMIKNCIYLYVLIYGTNYLYFKFHPIPFSRFSVKG